MNENISNNEIVLLKDIIEQKGLSKLFISVSAIDVLDERIKKSLSLFVDNVETNGAISVADVIFSAQDLVGRCKLNEAAGNLIYCFDNPTANKKIIKNTAVGLYRLLSIHNGVSLDLNAIGGSIIAAELKNYLIIPPNKVKKYNAMAKKEGIELRKVGCVLSGDSIILSRGNDIIETLNKSELKNNEVIDSISIDSRHYNEYSDGYKSLLSYALCDKITANNLIAFGLSDNLESIFARAFGFFAASLATKTFYTDVKYLDDKKIFNVSPRPTVCDGEYFYLLKLRNDMFGLPDMAHYYQLKLYLEEYKKQGVIKNVLPYRENIEETLRRLCTDSLVFETFTETTDSCFGIVVSVERGESLNGIKLGCFKNI